MNKKNDREATRIKEELVKKLNYADCKLAESPSGELRLSRSRGKNHFKHRVKIDGKFQMTYIRDEDRDFIKALAEKAYYTRIRELCIERLNFFVENEAGFCADIENEALRTIDEGSRIVMTEILAGEKTYADEWQSELYIPNPYKPERLICQTLRGEKVRSKGERDIADELFRNGIPYKLEYPVEVFGETIYSDFVILRLSDFREIHWEHSGMLEKDRYVSSNYDRIARYASVGIIIGQDLIITGETKEKPLSTQTIKTIVEAYCI